MHARIRDMDKAKNDFLDQGKCPVCGGEDFEWGRIGGQVVYRPGDNLWKVRGYQYIRARRCLRCNNLLQFADPELTRRQNKVVVVSVVVAVLFTLLAIMLPLMLASSRF
jgi:hypothetical protein